MLSYSCGDVEGRIHSSAVKPKVICNAMQDRCGERFARDILDKVREKGICLHSRGFDKQTAAEVPPCNTDMMGLM